MKVDRPGLERLERDLPFAIIFVAQPRKVVLADIHRQIAAPVVFVADEFNEAALLEPADLVGARAERRLKRRRLEVAALPPGGGKDRHAGDDEMRVAAA